ncbi:MAG: phosphate propanoyltransferase [Clostridia bacterium]|nr:phosphate propanoyltransferase [Clostridia bacterium]
MNNKVLVETSARHVHLSSEHIEALFGKGYELTVKKELSQPGQYACEERVTIVGPKKSIANVIILGPARKASQVEVSFTDARTLGITAPVKESGDIAGTPGCKLVGPMGEVELSCGVIVAKRHIHFTPEEAAEANVTDKEIVKVKITSEDRTTIFDDVVVRVNPAFKAAMHIDTDESNAACAFGVVYGEIIK